MSACAVCNRETQLRGIACPPCDAVLLVMSLVERHWLPSEMERLRNSLREESTAALALKARERSAMLMVKLLWHVQALAAPAGLQADDLKRRLCDALTKRAGTQRQIEKYEAEKGPDSYRLAAVQWITNALSGAVKPQAREAEPSARSAAVTLAAKFEAAAGELEPKRPVMAGFLNTSDGMEPLYAPESEDRLIS